jgi:hypothetical protein
MEEETVMLVEELEVLSQEYDRLCLKPVVSWWQAEELHQLKEAINRLYMILRFRIDVFNAMLGGKGHGSSPQC